VSGGADSFPESLRDLGGLELEDVHAAASLKYLRDRSLRNPRWRDADRLKRYVRRGGQGNWSTGSPVESYVLAVEHALRDYGKATKRGDREAMDALWAEVLSSVDRLLDATDRTFGRPVRPDLP
jgi:hypothetical protein